MEALAEAATTPRPLTAAGGFCGAVRSTAARLPIPRHGPTADPVDPLFITCSSAVRHEEVGSGKIPQVAEAWEEGKEAAVPPLHRCGCCGAGATHKCSPSQRRSLAAPEEGSVGGC